MRVFRKEDIRKVDQQAEQQGFSVFSLMENAGVGLALHIQPYLNNDDRILIVSGRGNNGGDGIVLARYLLLAGFDVHLTFPFGLPKTAPVKEHLAYYESQGYGMEEWHPPASYDVIIDAMLGIGTVLPLREHVAEVLHWCNASSALRIAIDVPTGVQADQGDVDEEVVFTADYTFALHGAKPSAFLLPSSKFYGKVTAISIGLNEDSHIQVITQKKVEQTLPKRGAATHKGTFGTSLLVAGSDEMPGSALLAAIGAIRSGTGKLMIGTSQLAASIIAPIVPEATYLLNGLQRISKGDMPGKIAAIGIGPGIADIQLAQLALEELWKQEAPVVVDAGALVHRQNWHAKGPLILTPHPGEFSRLTGKSIKEIQANRMALASEFAEQHQLYLVLKGNNTVIACPDGNVFINPTGNSGLAKGGSGDVLTGMIVSMLATHENVQDAVINAVFIHGLCADKWAEQRHEASMVASDLNDLLPIVLKELD